MCWQKYCTKKTTYFQKAGYPIQERQTKSSFIKGDARMVLYSMSTRHCIQIQTVHKTPNEKSPITKKQIASLLNFNIFKEDLHIWKRIYIELVTGRKKNKHEKPKQLIAPQKQKIVSKRKVRKYYMAYLWIAITCHLMYPQDIGLNKNVTALKKCIICWGQWWFYESELNVDLLKLFIT